MHLFSLVNGVKNIVSEIIQDNEKKSAKDSSLLNVNFCKIFFNQILFYKIVICNYLVTHPDTNCIHVASLPQSEIHQTTLLLELTLRQGWVKMLNDNILA